LRNSPLGREKNTQMKRERREEESRRSYVKDIHSESRALQINSLRRHMLDRSDDTANHDFGRIRMLWLGKW